MHRDIKPDNIQILSDGRIKLTDFGISRMAFQKGDQDVIRGKYAYMSPEQVRGEGHRLDGRSDLFSLGVIFYELLTGTTPFDSERFKEVGYDEMRRIIREDEPPKPSTRISTNDEPEIQANSPIKALVRMARLARK